MTEEKIVKQAQVELRKANELIEMIHDIQQQLHQLIEDMQATIVRDKLEVKDGQEKS